MLRQQLESMSALAREQEDMIKAAEFAANQAHDPIFFSVRPNPPKVIPALEGQSLDASLIWQGDDGEVNGNESPLDPQLSPAVAEIDFIEEGEVRGWACVRASDASTPPKMFIYVNRVLAATADADQQIDLPTAATETCRGPNQNSGSVPLGFRAELPLLPQGSHTLRAFVETPSGQLIEAHQSPAVFIESAILPDGGEIVRRKDAIILRRNAELVALWEEVKTQMPWRKAEALAAAEKMQEKLELDAADEDRLLTVVLAHSAPSARAIRNLARSTWAPKDENAAEELRSRLGIAVRFMVALPAGAMKEPLLQEAEEHGDILIVEEEGIADSEVRITLGGLALATSDVDLDADFYVISRDQAVVDLNAVEAELQSRRNQGNVYMGCMKKGEVVVEDGSPWFEPDSGRFGGDMNKIFYPPHAHKEFYALSRFVARHLARSRTVLHAFKFEDTSMGAWMMGLEVTMVDDGRFCCDSKAECEAQGPRCLVYHDANCNGVCDPDKNMPALYKKCVEKNKKEE